MLGAFEKRRQVLFLNALWLGVLGCGGQAEETRPVLPFVLYEPSTGPEPFGVNPRTGTPFEYPGEYFVYFDCEVTWDPNARVEQTPQSGQSQVRLGLYALALPENEAVEVAPTPSDLVARNEGEWIRLQTPLAWHWRPETTLFRETIRGLFRAFPMR